MKNVVYMFLLIGIFGCKAKTSKKNSANSSAMSKIDIDSMQIFYTLEYYGNRVPDSTAPDSTKKLFYLLNRPVTEFDEYDYVIQRLTNQITVSDSKKIDALKYCFSYHDSSEGMSVADCGLPIYRDIIFLYSNNQKIAEIKICFNCNYISIFPEKINKHVNINDTTIARLENYFSKNIHQLKRF